jgi:Fur family transcriptional regulator, ferric uptake regulator
MGRRARVPFALLALMKARERHAWTLEDLHSGLAGINFPADFSSVFRAAEKLAAEGQIRKLVLDDGRARFELADAHHDHLLCSRCGTLVPVPCLIDDATFAALERDTGVVIREHHLVLSGLCRNCHVA